MYLEIMHKNALPNEYEPNTKYNLTIIVDNGIGKGGFDLTATNRIISNADNNSKLNGEKVSAPKDREQVIPIEYKVEFGKKKIIVKVVAKGEKNYGDNEKTIELEGKEIKLISSYEMFFGILIIFFSALIIFYLFFYYWREKA